MRVLGRLRHPRRHLGVQTMNPIILALLLSSAPDGGSIDAWIRQSELLRRTVLEYRATLEPTDPILRVTRFDGGTVDVTVDELADILESHKKGKCK